MSRLGNGGTGEWVTPNRWVLRYRRNVHVNKSYELADEGSTYHQLTHTSPLFGRVSYLVRIRPGGPNRLVGRAQILYVDFRFANRITYHFLPFGHFFTH